MSIHEDVLATIGPSVGGRAYSDIAPSNAGFPYAVCSLIAGTPTQCLEGEIYPTNWVFQVDVFSPQKSVVEQIAVNIRAAMNASLLFKSTCSVLPSQFEFEAKLYRSTLNFSVWKVGE